MTLDTKEKFEKKQAKLWKALWWVVIAFLISLGLVVLGILGLKALAVTGVLGVVFSFMALFVIIGELEI